VNGAPTKEATSNQPTIKLARPRLCVGISAHLGVGVKVIVARGGSRRTILQVAIAVFVVKVGHLVVVLCCCCCCGFVWLVCGARRASEYEREIDTEAISFSWRPLENSASTLPLDFSDHRHRSKSPALRNNRVE